MMQPFGYLLAVFGWFCDITKGWAAPLGLLLFASGCLLFSGLDAAQVCVIKNKGGKNAILSAFCSLAYRCA
jgi:cyanate permease